MRKKATYTEVKQECFTGKKCNNSWRVRGGCMMLSMQNFSLDDAGLQRYCRDLMAMNFVCRDTAKLLEMTAEAEWGQSASWNNL